MGVLRLPAWGIPVRERLLAAGLNVHGVAPAALAGPAFGAFRSVWVIGSGGPALWHAFLEDLRRHPRHLAEEPHPLDAFVRRVLAEADPAPPPERRWVQCAAGATPFVDFRPLAQAAGLGWHGRTGLLLHPEHGPWMALRLACFMEEDLPATGPLPGPGPCADCEAPCVAACPASAVRPDAPPVAAFDVERCAAHHQRSTTCAHRCASREACPEGAASRYPDLEIRYHYDRAGTRPELARMLGVVDRHRGTGPHWEAWADG